MATKIDEKLAISILDFIATYTRQYGMPPSQREIAKGVYAAKNTVWRYLILLESRGQLYLNNGAHRGVVLKRVI